MTKRNEIITYVKIYELIEEFKKISGNNNSVEKNILKEKIINLFNDSSKEFNSLRLISNLFFLLRDFALLTKFDQKEKIELIILEKCAGQFKMKKFLKNFSEEFLSNLEKKNLYNNFQNLIKSNNITDVMVAAIFFDLSTFKIFDKEMILQLKFSIINRLNPDLKFYDNLSQRNKLGLSWNKKDSLSKFIFESPKITNFDLITLFKLFINNNLINEKIIRKFESSFFDRIIISKDFKNYKILKNMFTANHYLKQQTTFNWLENEKTIDLFLTKMKSRPLSDKISLITRFNFLQKEVQEIFLTEKNIEKLFGSYENGDVLEIIQAFLTVDKENQFLTKNVVDLIFKICDKKQNAFNVLSSLYSRENLFSKIKKEVKDYIKLKITGGNDFDIYDVRQLHEVLLKIKEEKWNYNIGDINTFFSRLLQTNNGEKCLTKDIVDLVFENCNENVNLYRALLFLQEIKNYSCEREKYIESKIIDKIKERPIKIENFAEAIAILSFDFKQKCLDLSFDFEPELIENIFGEIKNYSNEQKKNLMEIIVNNMFELRCLKNCDDEKQRLLTALNYQQEIWHKKTETKSKEELIEIYKLSENSAEIFSEFSEFYKKVFLDANMDVIYVEDSVKAKPEVEVEFEFKELGLFNPVSRKTSLKNPSEVLPEDLSKALPKNILDTGMPLSFFRPRKRKIITKKTSGLNV